MDSILILEDEGVTALHLRALLTGWGYRITSVADTAEAIEGLVESDTPDLVLMDIRLKGEMDGIEAAGIVHERFGIPVVFLSAHSDESTRRRIEESQAYGFVVKPFSEREIYIAVRSAIHRRRIERALAPAADGPPPTLPQMGDAVLATDAEGRIVYMNSSAERLTGWQDIDAFEHEATDVLRFNLAEDGSMIEHPVSSVLQDAVAGDGPRNSILTSRSGSQLPTSHRVTPVRDRFGELLGAVVTIRRRREVPVDGAPVTEDARADPSTRLVTPDLLDDYLGDAIARARTRHTMVSVFHVDIDRFAAITEPLGPDIGNGLLTAAAARLQNSVRASDSVVRIRDTTFAVIQADLEHADGAVILGQKLVRVVRDPFAIGRSEVAATASVGAALFPVDGDSPARLLGRAEEAAEKARAGGGDRLCFCSDGVESAITEERNLGEDLECALTNRQLEVLFQPVCDLPSRAIVGAEACLQWRHPTRGVVPASVFLPVAERRGMLTQIVDWMIREALTRGRTWHPVAPDVRVMVPLAGSEIRRRGLVPHLLAIFKDTGFEARHLGIELREDVLVSQPPMTTHLNLQRLRQLGVSLTLDNFGFGYASMMTLKKTPVHRVKVDRALIAAVTYEKEAQAIVKATIDLARSCGLEVAAEGIENESQWRWLRFHGCEVGQGAFLGGYIPAQQLFEKLVDHHR